MLPASRGCYLLVAHADDSEQEHISNGCNLQVVLAQLQLEQLIDPRVRTLGPGEDLLRLWLVGGARQFTVECVVHAQSLA